MPNFIVNFAHWLQNTGPALNIGGSDWAYPYVQMTHFTGLSLFVGSNVAGDLKQLGFGKSSTIGEYWDSLIVWNWIGFVIAVCGGFTLFSIAAVGYVHNPAFVTKIAIILPLALITHIYNQVKAKAWSQLPELPTSAKILGGIELALWCFMAIAAVSIPEF